jgi:hypothetical protein
MAMETMDSETAVGQGAGGNRSDQSMELRIQQSCCRGGELWQLWSGDGQEQWAAPDASRLLLTSREYGIGGGVVERVEGR